MKEGFKESRAVMEMLNFIINEVTLAHVLLKIAAIPNAEKVSQSFDIIRTQIEKLSSPHKQQVEAFVRFFEEHHDKVKLKEELDAIK